jgi:rubrerythrin
MDDKLSADEILSKAEEIERRGARFYRAAAQKASNKKVKRLLLDLAEMEDGHLRVFEHMRGEFADPGKNSMALESDGDILSYTQIVAEGPDSNDAKNPLEQMTGKEKAEDVLRMAIEAESRSILFYVGLRNLIRAKADKDRLEAIIKEEMSHVVSLNLSLTMLT